MKFRVGKFIAEKVEVAPKIFSPQKETAVTGGDGV